MDNTNKAKTTENHAEITNILVLSKANFIERKGSEKRKNDSKALKK